jgi:guanylate kinase
LAGLLFIISAPSGSGKSTLVSQLRTLVEGLEFSVSWTTRPPRGSEEHGREYNFTTRAEFERMIAAGEFLEHAEVFGNYYGTAISSLRHAEASGKDLLLDIDVQGGMQVMQKLPSAVSIFILPPSPEVLEKRLRNRSAAEHVTNEEVIERRLHEAREELKRLDAYKYALVNDVLDDAVAELRAIVLWARLGMKQPEGTAMREMAAACETRTGSPRLHSVLASFGVTK